MNPLIERHRSEIDRLCRRYGVARLALFGSATGPSFDPAISDVDFVVEFQPEVRATAFDRYFGLKEALEQLLGRKVDLITEPSIRNPYLRREIEASRQPLYGP